MSDERTRVEPTVGQHERPMLESLPMARSHTGDGSTWTNGAKITLSIMIALGALAGWHNYSRLQIQKEVQARADGFISEFMPKATATVTINPLSNFALIHVVTPPRSYEHRFANTVESVVVETVREELEPKLDRELGLVARRHFDLYAMALPYRVAVEVEAAPDPNRGWTKSFMESQAQACTREVVNRDRQGVSKRALHNFASRYCTCAVNEGHKQFSAKEFDELSGEDLERFMNDLVKRDPCNLSRYYPEFVKP